MTNSMVAGMNFVAALAASFKLLLHHHRVFANSFTRNAIIAIAMTVAFGPLIWLLERRWGDGVSHYRSRNFLHDFTYWAYYRLNIHAVLFEVWFVDAIQNRLHFLQMGLLNRLPLATGYILGYLVFDFIGYWGHRWQHHSRFLWAFHSVHHTQENLSFATLVRVHPVDRIISKFYIMLPALLLGSPFIWTAFFARQFLDVLEHARLNWTYGPFRRLFVSPAFHSMHHSTSLSEQHSNFGVSFSIWDYVFGTAASELKRPARYGIPELPSGSLWSQLILPFRILGEAAPMPYAEGKDDSKGSNSTLGTVAVQP